MAQLNSSERAALNEVAQKLRVSNPKWLEDMIYFETAGTFSPSIKNPLSSARGLIQFMDSTARGMGYAGSKDLVEKNPTFEGQIRGPVYEYLRPYAPFTKESDLYMAVFYPAARRYSTDTTFKEIFEDRGVGHKYPAFIKANPGILSPGHYVAKVKKKPFYRAALLTGGVVISLGIIGLAVLKYKNLGPFRKRSLKR